jgi:hypothetical protein
MSLRSLTRRRPSAALVVSILALFVSLGGAGWAALRIPPRSVGNAQLQNFSVGPAKLKPNSVGAAKIIAGAVGARQIDSSQVQLRVSGPCTMGAIQSIAASGNVTCTQVLANEYGTSAAAVTLGAGSTQIATESLPAGSAYLVLAYPHAVISGATGQRVEVDCTLSVPSGNGTSSTTKSLAVQGGSSGAPQAGTIPLVLPVASSTSAQAATVNCTDSVTPATAAPSVAVDSTLNALQTASNN